MRSGKAIKILRSKIMAAVDRRVRNRSSVTSDFWSSAAFIDSSHMIYYGDIRP
jgi:hypothetical protein